jgi:hypothetical protein
VLAPSLRIGETGGSSPTIVSMALVTRLIDLVFAAGGHPAPDARGPER